MKYRELDNNQIRFLTDIRQTYQTFLDAKQATARFKGSMKWKNWYFAFQIECFTFI